MFSRKNKDGMDMTKLTDTVLTALQLEDEFYTIDSTKSKIIISWRFHKVEIKGECIWFDGKAQHSVYNIVNAIKAGN